MSVLQTRNLSKIYGGKGKGLTVKALDDFNMNISNCETLSKN